MNMVKLQVVGKIDELTASLLAQCFPPAVTRTSLLAQ